MSDTAPLVEMRNISIAFGGIRAVDNVSVSLDRNLISDDTQHRSAWEADNRIAPPFLTALHRFEKIGVQATPELEIGGQGRL